MKKNVMFLIFTLIFCYVCVPSLSAQNGITATVTPDFDENDLPQAIPTHTFDFDVVLKVTDPSRDYDIKVVLTSSNFRGIAANAGDSLENDLYFDAEDNAEWTVSTDGTTLTYEYNSVNRTLPTTIKVRCRDNGAHGEIQLTIANTTIDITKHIPIDVNDNDIADGWEKAHGFFVADVGDAQDKAEADDEKGPYDDNPDNDDDEDNDDNKHPGDGWSRYDEYRGIYTTIDANGDPAGFTRLNPNKKDVIYTVHESMTDYGLGSLPDTEYGLDSQKEAVHVFTHVDSALLKKVTGHDPFLDFFEYLANGKVVHDTEIVVDDLVGRVNYNSNPGGGAPDVPGAQNVWALRIIEETDDAKSNTNPDRFGHATNGSPYKYSLIKIFPENIKTTLTNQWRGNTDNLDADVKTEIQEDPNAANTYIDAAIEILTNVVISHEVLHSLNISTHCGQMNCIMQLTPSGGFWEDGSFGMVKKKKNPKPEPNLFDENLTEEEKNGHGLLRPEMRMACR